MSIKHFKDTLSGRIFVYNTKVTPIINTLLKKSKGFPKSYSIIFTNFLASSDGVICVLFGIGKEVKDTQEIIGKIDIKTFKKEDFRKALYILITFYSYLLYNTNKEMKQNIKKYLFALTENENRTAKLLKELEQCEKEDIKTSVTIQEKVGKVFNIDKNNLAAAVFLEGLILKFYIEAIKEIKKVFIK